MKFFKNMVISSMVATGVYMLYNNNMGKGTRKMKKTGKKLIKKMGII